jgi:uncharacterized membrane protein
MLSIYLTALIFYGIAFRAAHSTEVRRNMKKYISVVGAALCGAALMAASAAAFYHFGDYVLLSPVEQNQLFAQIMGAIQEAGQAGYEACKAGM